MIAILMGVTGTGKTTVGLALAAATGWPFADADEFHSAANKAKMSAGIPLTDEDREPWLEQLHRQIVAWQSGGTSAILACSALKQAYRDTLVADTPPDAVRWVYLTGPAEVIRERIEHREGHFMPAALLPSQLMTLEPPRDAVAIPITESVAEMVEQIRQALSMPAGGELSQKK